MGNTLKYFLRSLNRNLTISIITIGGYALSMAVLLILTVFLAGELNVNKGFDRGSDIYRIVRSDNESIVPKTLLNDVREKIPGVEKICLYTIGEYLYKNGSQKDIARIIATNDDFLDIFSLHFIYQIPNPTLSVKDHVILTKDFSIKLFGKDNPVGKILEISNKPYTIVGIVNNIPANSSFKFDMLTNDDFDAVLSINNNGVKSEKHTLLNSFVRLSPKASQPLVNAQISGMISHWETFKDVKFSLQPLRKVYFNGLRNDKLDHANVNLIYLLTTVALIILFMTIFNYVNLAVAGGYDRLNEIGIKKINGARKENILRQVLTESLLVSLLAIILSLIASSILSPLFSRILGKNIEFQSLFSQPLVILSGILLFTATGILSGIYPALIFSGISPLRIMSHQKEFSQSRYRGIVVVVQFMITLVLIISLLFIRKQIEFVKYKDLGFDKEMMVRLDLGRLPRQKVEVLKEKLLAHPGIISLSGTIGSPMQTIVWSNNSFDVAGERKQIVTRNFYVDENFVKTFGLRLLAGRNIMDSDSNVCLINEHLYKELQWNDIAGKELESSKVVGIIRDFHYENLYNEIGNLELQQAKSYVSVLNIKINGNAAENLNIIRKIYAEVEPEAPFSFKFYDNWIQSMYQKEEKQESAIKVFAFIAIIISCLGLIGLAEHVTKRKIKEIGIRKVNGAKISEVLAMLNKDFVKWVIIAFVMACPIAYYAMNKWLQSFAYKTELSWWVFALAGILTLLIAILTVSWQSWRAATRNPVEALRYE